MFCYQGFHLTLLVTIAMCKTTSIVSPLFCCHFSLFITYIWNIPGCQSVILSYEYFGFNLPLIFERQGVWGVAKQMISWIYKNQQTETTLVDFSIPAYPIPPNFKNIIIIQIYISGEQSLPTCKYLYLRLNCDIFSSINVF